MNALSISAQRALQKRIHKVMQNALDGQDFSVEAVKLSESDGETLTVTITAGKIDVDRKKAEFAHLARLRGFDPDWYGKTITDGRKQFTVTGIRPNAPRRAFEVRDADGKVFVTSEDFIRARLLMAEATH